MGGEQHDHVVARPRPGDDVEQLVADARVEAGGRVVEEQHARPRHGGPAAVTSAAARSSSP
jgi:hypothetical protein